MIELGISKMALIGAIALIVIGPERLPRVARTVGALLGKAQRYVADIRAEVNRSMELDELRKMKESVETAARDVHSSVQTTASEFEQSWTEATAALEQAATPVDVPPMSLFPEYRHPGKKWRIKQGATPQWYKARAGVRTRALSGAARVARYRPRPAARGGAAPSPSGPIAMTSPQDDKPDELAGTEQPFVQHLMELRDRLIKAIVAVGLMAAVLALYPGPGALYDLLAAPLVATLPKGATLIATNVISPFMVPIKILFLAAFMLALPFVLYQVWAFVAPGLYSHEKRLVMPLVISSTALFFIGVAFCYYLVFGQVFAFIQSFAPKSITAAPDIEAYLSFAIGMFLAFGLAFEVPVAVILLVRMGIVSTAQLRQWRGYFWVGAAVVTAMVTPPDAGSMIMLLAVVGALYEAGIIAAQLFVKHTRNTEAASAPEPGSDSAKP